MPEIPYLTNDTFGLSRDVPLNYVDREAVDGKLINELTRDKHLVVYASSKQGKTCLRKACLKPDDYIVVQCSNRWALKDLHSAILKEAGFQIAQSETRTVSGSNKVLASAGVRVFGIGADAGGELEEAEGTATTKTPLELDIEDVNDVIRALESIDFKKYIVLEDFHYLSSDTQNDFAVALKAFHESSKFCFIVVGVWLEENRLIVYNGDLTGRVMAIDADRWSADELREVMSKGAGLLNIGFSEDFTLQLIESSEFNVYIVQEACRLACERSGVLKTQEEYREIGDGLDARALAKEIVDQQSGRYMSFVIQFSGGFQDTELEMYKWLLYPVLTADIDALRSGLGYRSLRETIEGKHPRGSDLNPGNITQALLYAASLQVKKNIKPIILDYDQSNLRLNVVDRGFLIWLKHQDRNELLEAAGLPRDQANEQLNLTDAS
ncbi:hypothetical protein AMJ39_08255 [candidate division TA06 bacterium DG_24]|uniref:Uncharacterized protein n=1 Tax=candidate division TA06 bacterium DG_24 TaxID=1703770 RepID=A0A0S7WQS3_UNCT6|nr:MAG: hypothetical protein AMJ39_08255 [candidate division TA06 bacterium DG_24]